MKYKFVGKPEVISESVKSYTEKKINKLEKFLPKDTTVYVTMTVVKLDHKVEVTIPLQKRVLRAEAVAPDMYQAIDAVIDILEKQIIKYKERLRSRSNRDNKYLEEYNLYFKEEAEVPEAEKVIKIKKFDLKPMDAEEAIMEMDLLGHSFFVFKDGETDEVKVVYKRKDGCYGLIEPEV